MRAKAESLDSVLNRAAQRVVLQVPSVSPAEAGDLVSRATRGPGLRQLEAHLRAYPDALTSGSSTAPAPVQVLAALLVAAGHEDARIPACQRCGAQKPLPNRVEGGSICQRCRYLTHLAPCVDCRRSRPINTRDENGQPLCESCSRARKHQLCGRCGQKRRVVGRADDGSPLCRKCDQTRFRTCCRCGQSAPVYANTADGPVCDGCYRQPRRRCGGCGVVRRIDVRSTATEPDLCARCRTRRQRNCTVCGCPHPANPLAVQPVCLACRDGGHILEPDLKEPADLTRRRRSETAHDVVVQRLQAILSDDDRGIAAQLTPLIEAFRNDSRPELAMMWLKLQGSGPTRLRELAIRAHREPITHALLDDYPPSNTVHRLRHLFVLAGVLPQRTELLDRIEPWLDQLLADRPHHHTSLVRPFLTWHALRRARQRARRHPITAESATYVRTQVTITLNFLSWLDNCGKTLATAGQADLDRWLDNGKQTTKFLGSFIGWAATRGLCDLTVPKRPRTQPEAFLHEPDRWSMVQRCLHEQTMPVDVRAAGILVLLFGRKTTSFMSLTVEDIRQIDGETYLRLGDFSALLPPAAAAVFHALQVLSPSKGSFPRPDPQTQDLFPGRSPGQPMTPASMSRKLRAHGISTLPSRNSARATWARDIPSPIAADVLGISIHTATQWAGRSRRDWSDYITARVQAQDDDDAQREH